MSDRPSDRPSPERMLERAREEENRARRGQLTIYFGFAPGVGKTYRMLQDAREMVKTHHRDIVVGLVEAHRRPETIQLAAGLENLPLRQVPYRGRVFDEFDLDAALARDPEVLVLDELAHTNAPGSRHEKRWQDAWELLRAGIDVLTTMNVQHVESLNDVVSEITHVRVRETVPDFVLDRADAIELVDITPEELLRRLVEGKIYLPERAKAAAGRFFRRGNLLGLRELAMRRAAERVDEDVQHYREEHHVSETWPAGERILAGVGPAPSSARLVRSASRLAARLRCPWIAAHVESGKTRDAERDRIEGHLRLAEALGAEVERLPGPQVAPALLDYARKVNVTRLVLGKSTRLRLRDLVGRSLLDQVVRGSGDIEIHVIGGTPRKPRDE